MIPKECKRLAEVDFPIAEVSRHAAREKSIRHGHPSTLHLWWARRPLASSRAVLMALLLPDPCDPHCPDEFKGKARKLLLAMRGRPSGWNTTIKTDEGLRQALLKFIADFANWDNSARDEYLVTSRGLVHSAHPEQTPLVVDPFAGGGSIPLEALRMGCDAFASDLNPVACLILKVMLEDIPRHGQTLTDELRKAGAEIKAQAEKDLADLYPKDPDGASPITYLWARTVQCESPNCGGEIPLMRSMWLCRKPNRKRALRPNVVREAGVPPRVDLEIFEPKLEREVANGTVSRARAVCLCCGTVLPPDRVRSQLSAQRGGADTVFDQKGNRTGGARMTVVVTLKPGEQGRHYRIPNKSDYIPVRMAQEKVDNLLEEWVRDGSQGLSPVPHEPLPLMSGTFNVPLYGINRWGDLFTARQKAALLQLSKLIAGTNPLAVRETCALAISKVAELSNSICAWEPVAECTRHIFGRQAIPIAWDFGEGVLTSSSSGSFEVSIGNLGAGIKSVGPIKGSPSIQVANATNHPLPDQSAGVWFTDPPYYFAVPYADLSDFFFVWLKRSLPDHPLLRDPFNTENGLTPKDQELCEMARWDPVRYSHKNKEFFENGMATAFTQGRRILKEEGIGAVVFAHRTTEGWEALLSGMIRGGWTITGSWPIATEMGSRLRARDSAALATSIHLICRPRPDDAFIGEWAEVLQELPERVGNWMQRLEAEGVRGADLVFACIGPALEIYSRYRRVETPEGHEVTLHEYLERVWEVVGREALKQVLGTAEAQARNGAAGALEEDARLTALFLWTMQGTADTADNGVTNESNEDDEPPQSRVSGFSLPYDVARRFAQPLGIHMEDWESRIIQTEKGVVKLIPVIERAKDLFGPSGADAMADEIETNATSSPQLSLFPDAAPNVRGRTQRRRNITPSLGNQQETQREATTLDRVHAAMLLQGAGRTEALRNLLRAEQDRGPDFIRLANALSALYPRGSEEKRLLDGMLLAVPR